MKLCPVCHLRYDERAERCLVDDARLETISDPRIGTVFSGRYALESVLGRGGMATVYRARHTLTDAEVAVKVLHDRFAEDGALRARLTREAQAARALAHPNVVDIHDVGETETGAPYLVMELLEGEPLDRVLASRGRLPYDEVVGLGLQIARGLGRAHDLGVVHRDVKPENVFVCRSDDGTPVVKLVDFGIALSPQDPRLTFSGQILGSPRYMAPERFKDRLEVIPSSDLYALGILLFELATGALPFESGSMAGFILAHMETPPPHLRERAPDAPEALDRLLFELMAKQPAHRPVDAHAVVAALSAMSTPSARRVRRASTFVSMREAPAGASARLSHFTARARAYDEMLAALPPDQVPPTIEDELAEVHAAIARLRALDARARVLDDALARREEAVRADRERLGHAVETLAQDLSRLRATERDRRASALAELDAYRIALRAVVTLDARHPEEPRPELLDALDAARAAYARWLASDATTGASSRDVEFQLDALRVRLEAIEADARNEQARTRDELRANADERGRLEERLVVLSTSIAAALKPRPELANHFARLASAR